MNQSSPSFRPIVLSFLLACVPLFTACSADRDADPGSRAPSALGGVVKRATDKAREKLATENISLSRNEDGMPKAEITPTGDLLIAGQAVAVDDAQRALLLEHRALVVSIAEAGIEIGVQGADLGMKAASMAIKGVLSGNTEEMERRIEAEAKKIEVEAQKICDLLPPLRASQQVLAAAIPAFVPYASMDQHDIDDCRSDANDADNSGESIEV